MEKAKRRKTLKRTMLWSIILFVIVFLIHWGYSIYGYLVWVENANQPQTYTQAHYGSPYINNGMGLAQIPENSMSSAFDSYKTNIASGRTTQVIPTTAGGTKNVSVDQKYEKTASIASETVEFEAEQKKIRDIITWQKAVIQQENRNGLAGAQQLYLEIGVAPDQFDALIEDIRLVGTLTSFNVQQVDKTEQYLQLQAERESLDATKEAYVAIKDMAETVDARIKLEEKILAVDRQIRDIDVNIGMFSDEYSFCTVKIELRELVEVNISNQNRVQFTYILTLGVESLWFTVQIFAVILAIVCGFLLAGVIITVCVLFLHRRIAPLLNKAEAVLEEPESLNEVEHEKEKLDS